MSESGSGGFLLASALKHAGTSQVFTLNGSHLWSIYLGTVEHGIGVIDVRHEQTAGFAAEGWAKLTRSCGVGLVTAGPGVTNSVSALGTARGNDSPVLLVGGRAPEGRWGQGSLQEIDHVPLVKTVTKSAVTVRSPADGYSATRRAIQLALSQRTGPAFVDLPMDVGLSPGEVEAGDDFRPNAGPQPDQDAVKAVARLLREARQPAVVAGGTVWWAHAERELLEVLQAAELPVVLNGLARGIVPPNHPLFATRARSTALGQADLILVVGAPLDFRLGFGQPPLFNEQAKVVYLDVDDYRKHRPPAAAVYGNLRVTLALLAEELRDAPPSDDHWQRLVAEKEEAAVAKNRDLMQSEATPIHPLRLLAEVEHFCDRDAIFVGDGGDFVSYAGRLIHRDAPGLWMDVGSFGCLGAGPGYALAAKLLHPERQVVLLAGDGAFGFSGLELDTFVRHRLPIVVVVGNNGIWGLEKHTMHQLLGMTVATDLRAETRYDRVVEALGGYGEQVERPDQIRPALDRAFKAGVPACLNVLLDPQAQYPRSDVTNLM